MVDAVGSTDISFIKSRIDGLHLSTTAVSNSTMGNVSGNYFDNLANTYASSDDGMIKDSDDETNCEKDANKKLDQTVATDIMVRNI